MCIKQHHIIKWITGIGLRRCHPPFCFIVEYVNKHSLCWIYFIILAIIAIFIDRQNWKMLASSIENLKNQIKTCLCQKKTMVKQSIIRIIWAIYSCFRPILIDVGNVYPHVTILVIKLKMINQDDDCISSSIFSIWTDFLEILQNAIFYWNPNIGNKLAKLYLIF